MWIFTPIGFFSVVEAPAPSRDELCVRGRVEKDLEALVAALDAYETEFELKVVVTPRADYPFRVYVSKEAFARYMADAIRNLDYTNFKNEVAKKDANRSHLTYLEIWSVLREDLDPRFAQRKKPTPPPRVSPMRAQMTEDLFARFGALSKRQRAAKR